MYAYVDHSAGGFTVKEALYIWILLMSLITFVTFGIDKNKAVHHKERISEKTLLTLSLIGGAFGGLLGMKVFHHKTLKKKFRLVSLFAILWVMILFACILNVI